jgi:hypothetical protein
VRIASGDDAQGVRILDEDQSFESGAASLSSNAQASGERRDVPRILSVLRVAKLISAAGEELCRIRNISAGGVMAEVAMLREVGDRVAVEIASGQPIAGEVVWTRGLTIGIRFDACIDVAEVLTHRRTADGHVARPPRLEIHCNARLRMGARYYNVQVHNLSQGGIKVEIDDPHCSTGLPAVVTIADLGTMEGVVRWCRDGYAGISFNSAIPFERLTRWLGVRLSAARAQQDG